MPAALKMPELELIEHAGLDSAVYLRIYLLGFWTHIVIAYAFTLWTCYVLLKEYATIASMRLQFLATTNRRPDQFTVIVRNVPPDPDKSISELVEEFFSVNHPDYYLTHQEAMMKDTLERASEPNLNLEGYLQNAYIHPVFKNDDDGDNEEDHKEKWEHESVIVPTKRQSQRNTPVPSKYSGSSSPSLPEVQEHHMQP